jgi:hypothetical protein
MATQSKLMQERYGIRPDADKRRRVFVIALGSALLITFLIWSASSIIATGYNFKTQTLGYTIVSKQQALVRYHIEAPVAVDLEAHCGIQVLNESFAVVGYREITVPPQFKGDLETLVNTSELGVTGSLDKCWFK